MTPSMQRKKHAAAKAAKEAKRKRPYRWDGINYVYGSEHPRAKTNPRAPYWPAVAIALVLLMLFLTAPAFAGHPCYVQRQAFVAHHQAYVAPVAINYFVGQPIRAEAIVEKALRDDPDYEAFQRFKQWKQIENGRPAADATQGATLDANLPETPDSSVPILYQHCGGCHSGAAPKAGLLLDGSAYIDCKTLVKCIDEIEAGTMPKAKPNQAKPVLTAEQQDAVIAALSRLVKESP
jgi:mono/diheme cytochrome c family protein